MIRFTVYGVPAPKGSKSAFAIRKGGALTGRVAVVEGKTTRQKDWSRRVEEVVQGIASNGRTMLDGPVVLAATFYLPRPKSEPKRRRTWPHRKPDVDKLLRALLDPMTGVLFHDDAQVVEARVSKDYAEQTSDPRPRAEVALWSVEDVRERRGGVADTETPGPESRNGLPASGGRAGDLHAATT